MRIRNHALQTEKNIKVIINAGEYLEVENEEDVPREQIISSADFMKREWVADTDIYL